MTRLWPAMILVLISSGCQPGAQVGEGGSPGGTANPAPEGLTRGSVVRVNDGDSLVIDTGSGEVEVRLMGINTPESDECHGPEAEERLREVVGGQEIGLDEVGRDQFDRTLAYVWLGDLLVNLDQVGGGFAIATTPEEGDPNGPALLDAEEEAVGAGLGMWSETACGASGPVPPVEVDGAGSSFDPPGPNEEVLGDEWVALAAAETVDLGGWVIRDESSEHRCHLPAGTSIDPGTGLIVASTDPCWDPGDRSVWNNGGDMALLLDSPGRVVARYRYLD